jgi:hypothetical protein
MSAHVAAQISSLRLMPSDQCQSWSAHKGVISEALVAHVARSVSTREPWSTDCHLVQTTLTFAKGDEAGSEQFWTAAISLLSALGTSVRIVSHGTRKGRVVLSRSSKLLRGLVFSSPW